MKLNKQKFLTKSSHIVAVILVMIATTLQAEVTITYYHNDLLGSPVAATDENGELLWSEEYQPYGAKLNNEQRSRSNKLWYTGKAHDEDTGLTYFGARYYDPIVGRFMGIDPVRFTTSNPTSFNRYAYANNNPYKFVDPDGRDARILIPLGIITYFVFTAAGQDAIKSTRRALDSLNSGFTISPVPGIDPFGGLFSESDGGGKKSEDGSESDNTEGSGVDDIDNEIEDDYEDIEAQFGEEKYPLKNRERRNKERRERPKDSFEKEKRQRDLEERKRLTGRGGADSAPPEDDF